MGGVAGLLVARSRSVRFADQSRQHPATRGHQSRRHGCSRSPWSCRSSPALLFGLAPALRAARVDLNTTLKAGGRNTQGEGGLGRLAATAAKPARRRREVAISMMLLVGAGLLDSQFRAAATAFRRGLTPMASFRCGSADRRVSFRTATRPWRTSPTSETNRATVPGVKERGAVSALPFTSSVGWGSINVEGWTPEPGQELQVDQRAATPEYFSTMKIPLVQGRFFTDADMPQNAEQVVVIDKKFAQRFWPNGDAIGKHVWFDPERKLRIVGVVGTVKQYGLDVDGRIVVYRPQPNAGYHVARTSAIRPAVAGGRW